MQDATLNDLVIQFDPTVSANEYLSVDDDLNMCYTFDCTGEGREELRALVCEAPLAKRIAGEESDREDCVEDDCMDRERAKYLILIKQCLFLIPFEQEWYGRVCGKHVHKLSVV